MAPEEHEKEIFISYAWGGDSEEMVDAIAAAFAARGYTITRDKSHLTYRESIKDFMDRIGRGKYIIVVVSDKYMKSEYCMYEAYRMFQSPEFSNRVYPIVLDDADIFRFDGQAAYLIYWTRKLKELRQQHKEVSEEDPTVAIPLTLRLRDVQLTTRFINDFMARIADMNVLTPEHHADTSFGYLIRAVESDLLGSEIGPAGIMGSTHSGAPVHIAESGEVGVGGWERFVIKEPIEMEFMRIPAGEFLMGSDPKTDEHANEDEQPQHRVTLSEYYIGKFPVTNSQYAVFASATSRTLLSSWNEEKIPDGKADHPVAGVTWHDAVAFCEWLSKESGHNIRLPTEAEWEKAARGTNGQIYPWGNEEPTEQLTNFRGTFFKALTNLAKDFVGVANTSIVGRFSPQGDSPYGCVDMSGNVWEWVADRYGEEYYGTLQDGLENPPGPESGDKRVVRGGSWNTYGFNLRTARRLSLNPDWSDFSTGIRCARSA